MIYINNSNDELAKISKSVSESLNSRLTGSTVDLESTQQYINPPVPFTTCEYIYLNCADVFNSCNILKDDLLYGDIEVYDKEDNAIKSITNILNENKDELKNLLIDYNFAGCAILEYGFSEREFFINQLPISTCRFVKTGQGRIIEQKLNNTKHYFKIMGEYYPIDFTHYDKQKLGYCTVFSGDNIYSLFKVPKWYPLKKKILTSIGIDDNNYNTVVNGNINNSLLIIGVEPEYKFDEENDSTLLKAQSIKDELTSGNGVGVVFAESNKPITTDYVKFDGKNNKEEQEILKNCQEDILNIYQIPRIRLLDNTETESMNSEKSKALWEIYTLNLQNMQGDFFIFIKEFLYDLYRENYTIKCDVPVFADNKETVVNTLINLFANDGLTLGEFIDGVANNTDFVDLDEYDLTKPKYQLRKSEANIDFGGL